MTIGAPFLVGPPADRSRPWRVLTDGGDSAGIGFGDARVGPGVPGPGRHVHIHEDEAIYVVSGVLTVEVGDHTWEAGPETLVWLPRGVPHVLANLGDEEVRTVGVFNSLSLARMFAEQADYFAGLHGPPDPEVLLDISLRHGVHPVEGPPLVRDEGGAGASVSR